MGPRRLLLAIGAVVTLAGSGFFLTDAAHAVVLDAPACTSDPAANTRALQATIDQAESFGAAIPPFITPDPLHDRGEHPLVTLTGPARLDLSHQPLDPRARIR